MAEKILLSPAVNGNIENAPGRYFYSKSLGFGDIRIDDRIPTLRIELEDERLGQHLELPYYHILQTVTEDSLAKEAILNYRKSRIGKLFSNKL
jgi:hypothetical protein